MNFIFSNLIESLTITLFVFITMLLVDYINIFTSGGIVEFIKRSKLKQYVAASFLGATPGCLGAFINVSFYLHGIITFGAITGGMIATSGDEAFVMLALFPNKAILLFITLFLLGIIFSFLADYLAPLLKIKPSAACKLTKIHPEDKCKYVSLKNIRSHIKYISLKRVLLLSLFFAFAFFFAAEIFKNKELNLEKLIAILLNIPAIFIIIMASEHYLNEHIWSHLLKKHLWRIFLWTLGTIMVINAVPDFLNLEHFLKTNTFLILLSAAIVGIIPESGPHLLFVIMFSKGLIPFSVLLTNSIIQDGHGMLPLLSHSFKDPLLIKLYKLIIGLGIGTTLYFMGL